MKEDYEIEEKKQAAADVLFQYSKFVMACIGNQARPAGLRLHLMKEISGLPTSLKRESSHVAASPDAMGESSSSGNSLGKLSSWIESVVNVVMQQTQQPGHCHYNNDLFVWKLVCARNL